MQKKGIDWLLVPVSSDLQYLAGYKANPSERLTLLCLPQSGKPSFVLPAMETGKLGRGGYEVFYSLQPWGETEDPYAKLKAMLGNAPGTVAIGEKLWSVFLLGMIEHLPNAKFVPATDILVPLRMRKDAVELENLREVGRRMDEVFSKVCRLKFAGRTEMQVASDIFQIVKDLGLTPIRVGGVASGPHSSSPHHQSTERVIETGDSIWIELGQGGSYNGYVADMTRTFHVGKPSAEYLHAYQAARGANETAFKAVRLGLECQAVDRAGRKVIQDAGLGQYFPHRIGHGLGLDGHEPPYMVEGNKLPIEQGMVFSIEPGVYVPGRFGMRVEDIVIATSSGAENTYASTHDLIIVE